MVAEESVGQCEQLVMIVQDGIFVARERIRINSILSRSTWELVHEKTTCLDFNFAILR